MGVATSEFEEVEGDAPRAQDQTLYITQALNVDAQLLNLSTHKILPGKIGANIQPTWISNFRAWVGMESLGLKTNKKRRSSGVAVAEFEEVEGDAPRAQDQVADIAQCAQRLCVRVCVREREGACACVRECVCVCV